MSVTWWRRVAGVWMACRANFRRFRFTMLAGTGCMPSSQDPCVQLSATTLALAVNMGR